MMTTLPKEPGAPVSVAKLLKARVVPTAPPKVVVALLLRVSELAVADAAEVSIVPPKRMLPSPLLKVALSDKVTGTDPNVISALVVLICPAALMLMGAVAVKPPANVNVSVALLPKVKVPVLLNTVAA